MSRVPEWIVLSVILLSVFLLSSNVGLTGAAVSAQPSSPFLVIVLLAIGAIVILGGSSLEARVDTMFKGPAPPAPGYDFDAILSDDVSERAKKGLRHFGEKLLRAYHGKKRFQELNPEERDRCAYELGKINLLMRGVREGKLTPDEKTAFFARYRIHRVIGGGFDGISVEAPQFNQARGSGYKGNFRYIFDQDTFKYEGLAVHPKNKYSWSD